jgi:hypothetical protein
MFFWLKSIRKARETSKLDCFLIIFGSLNSDCDSKAVSQRENETTAERARYVA